MQKAWQAWTFVDFCPERSVQDGRAGAGVAATGCACVASGFLPAAAAGGYQNRGRLVLSRPRRLHPV